MLTPVLQPPEVKEYLSKGERFIKWDDVSIETSLGWVVCMVTVFWSGLRGAWECVGNGALIAASLCKTSPWEGSRCWEPPWAEKHALHSDVSWGV